MKKIFTVGVSLLLVAAPLFACADTQSDRLNALYAQLVPLLKEELAMLQPTPRLIITPSSGQMPLSVTMTLASSTQTEAIDFGDGHSSGSNGCNRNSIGFCDLSQPIQHTYAYPGTYTVTLYKHIGLDPIIVTTYQISVTK